jgi:hypothetical protein
LNLREKPEKSQDPSNARIAANFSDLTQDAEFADPITKISESSILQPGSSGIPGKSR